MLDLLHAATQISHLHGVADRFAEEDAAGDVATSSKLNVLGKGQPAAQPANKQQQLLGEPMAFSWSSIIWTRALQHSNLQVCHRAGPGKPADLHVTDALPSPCSC